MPDDQKPTSFRRKLKLAGAVGLCAAAAIVVVGVTSRSKSAAELRAWTIEQATPTVAVAPPSVRGVDATLDLPGRLEAYSRAPIYARVSGYVKSWNADIGAHVKEGQVLAEIDAPDLDQQLIQARADLLSQEASARLSEATYNRRKALLASNIVSRQEIDERAADLANRKAAVEAGKANVERLEALSAYKKITAPFDGVVTQRNTDVGALISGGTGSGPAMFVISDLRKLRVYVDVPQSYVPAVRIGATAAIAVPEYPDRKLTATVEASSRSVDVGSGATRMQLVLDNPDGKLMPGGFARLKLKLTRSAAPLYVPATALIFNREGMRVATVDPNDRIVFKTVTIARDLGREIEIGSGVKGDDRIVVAPPDGLSDGDKVRVAQTGGPGKPASDSESRQVSR